MASGQVQADEPNAPYNWSGFYIGGQLGYGWGTGNADWSAVPPGGNQLQLNAAVPAIISGHVDRNPSGFMGGGQLGYNFMFGPWLVGLEGSLTGGDLSDTSPYLHPAIPSWLSVNATADTRWVATLTPRIGYAWDNWLVYAKGGYAAAGITVAGTANGTVPGGPPINVSIEHRERLEGWTVGGGVEYGYTRNVTLGLEYDYVSAGGKTISGSVPTPGGPATYQADVDGDIHMLTVHLNFRLN